MTEVRVLAGVSRKYLDIAGSDMSPDDQDACEKETLTSALRRLETSGMGPVERSARLQKTVETVLKGSRLQQLERDLMTHVQDAARRVEEWMLQYCDVVMRAVKELMTSGNEMVRLESLITGTT